MKRLASSILLVFCAAGIAGAEPLKISNDKLTVTYDKAGGTFSVADKASGREFLASGRLYEDAAGAVVEPMQHETFGKGSRIVVALADGGEISLELCDESPFVMIRGTLVNKGKKDLNLKRLGPVSFMLDLGKSPEDLRTMGTAGLTAPDKNPGSYLFLTLDDPATRHGVVSGFVTNERGSGVLFSDVKNGGVRFKAQIDYGHLRLSPGEFAKTETLAVGYFDDARLGEEAYADTIRRIHHIQLHPRTNGYCTWYSDKHSKAGDEKSIVELADFAARELKPFGFSFVQLDDEWQDGGTFNGPRRGFDRVKSDGPYPHGMAPVAEKFKNLGLTAGIWFMPFARNHKDPEYKDRQNWFVKRDNGQPYEVRWGGTSLDLTFPEVQDHLTKLVKTIHGWGYNYFKMDGLWTGSATELMYVNDGYVDDHMGNNLPFHNPKKTNVDMLRDGLRLVRQAAGPDVFFSGCNVSQNMRSFGACMGLVDSMRIGPDNGTKWDELIVGPVRGTRLYFLNGRTWWNDPDPSYVRADLPLNEGRFLTSWVALSDSFNLNSDWIPDLPVERLDVMKRTMPYHGATARPVDYFDNDMPRIWHVSDTRQAVRRDVLGFFNWDGKDAVITTSAAKAGLDAAASTWHGFDFWANEPVADFKGELALTVPGRSCRVIAVRADAGHPVLLSTSRHVSQGILEVTDETWNADTQTLSGVSQVVANDPYELRIAGIEDGGKSWKPVSAEADEMTTDLHEGSGIVRVKMNPVSSGAVKWSVKFKALPAAGKN